MKLKRVYYYFLAGDGRLGLKKYAPFNAIHVGASTEKVPQSVIF